ncbi:MAG: hypothetical protein K2V38_06170, partial [Gemmataceae bacterium]|nr:hypothetical protein [Gemmataceae bacterium]
VRTLEKLEAFDPARGDALGWLGTVAHNLAVSRLRREGRYRRLSDEGADGLASGEASAERVAAARDELTGARARLSPALRDAPPRVQRAWAMLMDDGLKYQEVADALRVPMGTVASWISKIRKQVRGGRSGGRG